jgi:hypothetical protein
MGQRAPETVLVVSSRHVLSRLVPLHKSDADLSPSRQMPDPTDRHRLLQGMVGRRLRGGLAIAQIRTSPSSFPKLMRKPESRRNVRPGNTSAGTGSCGLQNDHFSSPRLVNPQTSG